MPLLDAADPRPVHFMGIAGAGMSALADLCRRRGATVTGCDHSNGGHDPAHVAGHRAVVVTSAVPKDHPELAAAHAAGIPVIRRAEALAEATAGGMLIGIAGTHGKSTTTVMTTAALAAAGKNPTGVVGARVRAWGGNLSDGGHDVFVVEADEYDRSFLALWPTVAVVTNVEADHLDIYADLADITATFSEYVRRARYVVLCADDAGANALPSPVTAEVIRYGVTSPDARLVAYDIRNMDGGSVFQVKYDGKPMGEVRLRVPGLHNVRNALAALACGIGPWGLTVAQMAPGLAEFIGAERRFERLGNVKGIEVVDDYAHHPTELRATLTAAREAFPNRRILAAFQPHLFSRTRDFASDFGDALASADHVFLADIYPSREKPIDGVTSQLIANAMMRRGLPPKWMGPRTAMAAALRETAQSGDIVITIGAGDVTKTGPELLALLERA
jgi:UDP-N-acetylmuramate--alanine ligase